MDDEEVEAGLRELIDAIHAKGPFMRLDQVCHDTHLLILAKHIGEWRSVARWLGFNKTVIEDLDRSEGEGKRQEMLLQWKERNGSNATYRRLAKIMMNCERRLLAEDVVILSTKGAS